ncbi:MAG: hypothetical protein ACLTMH_18395 [Faecalimonas umbilicata]|uniref:hypothetical protein n=1 Tax=Faecalimonas umbilicata TaxID=1912855 RepID=UPI003995ADD2
MMPALTEQIRIAIGAERYCDRCPDVLLRRADLDVPHDRLSRPRTCNIHEIVLGMPCTESPAAESVHCLDEIKPAAAMSFVQRLCCYNALRLTGPWDAQEIEKKTRKQEEMT